MSEETWRIQADEEQWKIEVIARGDGYVARWSDGVGPQAETPVEAIIALAYDQSWSVVEVTAPGETTRAEALAALSAQLAAAQAAHDALAREVAAYLTMRDAVGAEVERQFAEVGHRARWTSHDDDEQDARAALDARLAGTAPDGPPTEAEAASHNARGGWWCVSRAGVCPPASVEAFRGDGDVAAYCAGAPDASWVALDAAGRACGRPATGDGQ